MAMANDLLRFEEVDNNFLRKPTLPFRLVTTALLELLVLSTTVCSMIARADLVLSQSRFPEIDQIVRLDHFSSLPKLPASRKRRTSVFPVYGTYLQTVFTRYMSPFSIQHVWNLSGAPATHNLSYFGRVHTETLVFTMADITAESLKE